jgi:hypothetical protein
MLKCQLHDCCGDDRYAEVLSVGKLLATPAKICPVCICLASSQIIILHGTPSVQVSTAHLVTHFAEEICRELILKKLLVADFLNLG